MTGRSSRRKHAHAAGDRDNRGKAKRRMGEVRWKRQTILTTEGRRDTDRRKFGEEEFL
jgi:hypothetical protein